MNHPRVRRVTTDNATTSTMIGTGNSNAGPHGPGPASLLCRTLIDRFTVSHTGDTGGKD